MPIGQNDVAARCAAVNECGNESTVGRPLFDDLVYPEVLVPLFVNPQYSGCAQAVITGVSRGKMRLHSSFRGGDHRARLGLKTRGPTRLLTDLCVFEPDPRSREMVITSIHAGVTQEQIAASTGWNVRYAANLTVTPRPTREELDVLRQLYERTRRAHA